MSGVVLVYYLRFWFLYQFPNSPVAGTPYAGAAFFDYIVTWCEFGPWLACLILDHARRRIRARRGDEKMGVAPSSAPRRTSNISLAARYRSRFLHISGGAKEHVRSLHAGC